MSNFRKRLPPKAKSGASTTTGEDKSKYVHLDHSVRNWRVFIQIIHRI